MVGQSPSATEFVRDDDWHVDRQLAHNRACSNRVIILRTTL